MVRSTNRKTGKGMLVCVLLAVFLVVMASGFGVQPQKAEMAPAPQVQEDKRDVVAAKGVVAAAHPLAAQAGLEILKKGGNAIDAAVATSFALAVVEPNASGMGGGGFALVYIAKENKTYFVDYREMAPAKARPDTYIDAQGKVIPNATRVGYLASGVPGHLRGMEALVQKFGTMKWAELMEPAIKQAEIGLPVGKTFSGIVTDQAERLAKAPHIDWMKKVFFKDDLPVQPGDVVKNDELTQSLKKVAKGGADVFYKGEIAELIAKEYAKADGWITKEDLANYKVVMREPLEANYRGYTVVTSPPPSSGGLTIMEILNIVEGYDLPKMGHGSADTIHTVIEAQKLAYADRARYMADPDFAKIPMEGMLSKKYAAERRKLIDPQKASPPVQFGDPAKYESGSTTSFSVIDKDGNIITITQTINDFMGSGVVPEGTGIMMNDEMDDFTTNNPNSVNAPQPGKRPLSSMSPTIILKDGKPFMTIGSPGATRIITALANITMNVIDFKMDIQPAINAPRFHNTNGTVTYVEGRISQDVLRELEARGHKFEVRKDMDLYFGGAQGILYGKDKKLRGGGDPRRDGVAVGY